MQTDSKPINRSTQNPSRHHHCSQPSHLFVVVALVTSHRFITCSRCSCSSTLASSTHLVPSLAFPSRLIHLLAPHSISCSICRGYNAHKLTQEESSTAHCTTSLVKPLILLLCTRVLRCQGFTVCAATITKVAVWHWLKGKHRQRYRQ
jgi:hypothetical protein